METTPTGRKRLTDSKVANRRLWVGALLDGSHDQGAGQLHTDSDTWCCLGVAGDVLDPGAAFLPAETQALLLPQRWAADKLGITSGNCSPGHTSDQGTAAGWNDSYGLTFAEIADRIALATINRVRFEQLSIYPAELEDREAGDFAREWLEATA